MLAYKLLVYCLLLFLQELMTCHYRVRNNLQLLAELLRIYYPEKSKISKSLRINSYSNLMSIFRMFYHNVVISWITEGGMILVELWLFSRLILYSWMGEWSDSRKRCKGKAPPCPCVALSLDCRVDAFININNDH